MPDMSPARDAPRVLVPIAGAWLPVSLDRAAERPLPEQIADALLCAMREGLLPPGVKLPSIRALASRLAVSPHTVVEAYDRLAALALVASRPGAGVFVAAAVAPRAPAPAVEEPADWCGLVTGGFNGMDAALAPGNGYLPNAWLDGAWCGPALSRFQRGLCDQLTRPVQPQGHLPLREQIATRLAAQGIPATPEGIAITYGSTQAMDLLMRLHLSPGDSVLVEDPGYFLLFPALRRHGLRLLPIPRLADGPDLDAVAAAIREHAPRAFILQPVLQNPTGTTAAPAVLHRLLALAEAAGMLLVEEDVYGDLHSGAPVRLAQLGGLGRVTHVGAFTKMLGPAMRVGFVATTPDRAEALTRERVLSVLTGSRMEELLLAEMLASGQYRRHLERLRPRVAQARALASRRLAALGFTLGEGREGGMFLWARLPDGADPDAVAARLRARGVMVARGSLFRPDGGPSRHLRFNATRATDAQLYDTLAEVLAA
jgi:DNA-binding transcriptional MocR family regulator